MRVPVLVPTGLLLAFLLSMARLLPDVQAPLAHNC